MNNNDNNKSNLLSDFYGSSTSSNNNINTSNSENITTVNNFSNNGIVSSNENINDIESHDKGSNDVSDLIIKNSNISNNSENDHSNFDNNINNNVDEEKLVMSFIGNNYDKIISNKFSLPAFFFGGLYLYYRKMFLYGIIVMIIQIVMSLFNLGNYTIIINIVLALTANKIYLYFVRGKVAKIKETYQNKDEDIVEVCKKKGGTSFGMVIGGLFLNFILAVIILFLAIILGIGSLAGSFLGELFKSSIPGSANNYNGIIQYDDSVKLNDVFSMVIPTDFQNDDSTDYMYNYKMNSNPNDTMFGNCNFTIGIVNNATSSEKLAKSMAKYNNASDSLEEKTINDIKWYYLNYSSVSKEHVYLTEIDKKVFIYEYEIGTSANENLCITNKDTIINSIYKK